MSLNNRTVDSIKHFTSFETGVSAFSTLAGFNVCDYAGAAPRQVADHRAELAAITGARKIFIPRQTHSVNVAIPGQDLNEVDALVTNRPGQLLCINTADCLPLLLFDPEAAVIGAAHCGWRGAVGGIARATLLKMQELGARPERTLAAVGPHICSECFEVGPEVAAQFPPEAVINRPGLKPHVSLLAAVKLQLPGVTFTNAPLCSMHDSRFYSVRRQGRNLPFRTLSAIQIPSSGYC
ncbi:MAG: laccase domain-containing protein [Bacteroides sp.]|nr:laccase domain-containing protein [Bacteroides sp.]